MAIPVVAVEGVVLEAGKIRIAIFTDLYLEIAGGIPSSISAQKTALEKLGHEVTIFCPSKKPTREKNVFVLPTAHFRVNGAPVARWPKIIIKFIDKNFPNFKTDFDLVHVHYEAGASIAGIILAKKYQLPLIQTMHGREDMAIAVNVPTPFKTITATVLNLIHRHYLKRYTKPVSIKKDHYLAKTSTTKNMWELMVREANCADQIITPSQHFAKKLQKYGVSKPITAVSNGVPDQVVNNTDWTVRALKQDKKAPLRLIWTNRLSREKRIMPFLEALVIVKKTTNQFFFTAVGNGNELETAKQFVLKNDLKNNVKFFGAVSRAKAIELLKSEHLSIINSYGFDTQGLTILEAGAVGLPVIYCDKDMDEIVLEGAGLRAKNESPEAMAELILSIIKNPQAIEKMSRAAFLKRTEVLQSTQIKSLLKVYHKTLDSRI